MSTVHNPIIPLTYSTYVPQQVDIENNVYNHILETELKQYDVRLKTDLKQYDVRLKTMEKSFEKIKEEFNTTIKIRFCDGIIGIVLMVVIYVKVYSH